MTSRGLIVISANAMDGIREKMKKLRQRMLHKQITARIVEKGQQRWSLTENITNSSITVDYFMSSSMPMKEDLQQNYQALQRALSQVGYFRRGTLLKRFMPCGKPGCACQGSPPRLHGPYYQWTRKVDGKTVTVRLTPEQADLLAGWIATGREMDRIISEMERLSLLATDRFLKELPPPVRKAPAKRTRARRAPKR
jgi:hypothetical protein